VPGFADLLDSTPVLEFEFEHGKLSASKLGSASASRRSSMRIHAEDGAH
jgi:hypothetical protein